MKITRLILTQKGFTLLELLLVMVVIAAIAGIGVTTFNSYSKNQAFSQAVFDFVNTLNTAKARAYSQVVPSGCISLEAYSVSFTSNSYSMNVVCSGVSTVVKTTNFPGSAISITTTPRTITFSVLTGGVIGNGSVVFSGYGGAYTKTVNISPVGVISAP